MADIVLINPRFEVSYWGMEHALPLLGKRANMPVACLPLLAALTPGEHTVTLIDENVEPIDFDALRPGRHRRRHRHERPAVPDEGDPDRAEATRGCSPCVGGPWVTVQEDYFDGLADVDLHRRGRGDLAAVPRRSGSRGGTRSATSRPRRPT